MISFYTSIFLIFWWLKMSNIKRLSILAVLLFSQVILAEETFEALVNEFLEQNYNIRSSKSSVESSIADKSIFEASTDTNFDFKVNYLDNNLDSPTVVNFAAGKTTQATLSLSKFFKFGTTVSFENTFSNTIQDPTRVQIFGGDPEVSEFKQTLTLSQSLTKNLLGRSFKLGLQQNELLLDSAKNKYDLDTQNGVGGFSKAYINLMQARDFLLLQKEAYDRAKKRKELIDRRVRDGLSLKVDGLQSQIQLLNQLEQYEQAKQNFSKAKINLGKLLHRDVGDKEKILKFGQGMAFLSRESSFDILNNPAVKLVGSQMRVAETSKNLARNNKKPDVDFVVRYQTNDFDAESSEVFGKGNLAGSRNFLTVSVTATMPFGNIKAKKELQKAKFKYQDLAYQLSQIKSNAEQEYEEISRQLELTRKNVRSSNQSILLSKKSLGEYNKLYRLGKVSLDQVINAEQLLISNQKKYIGYLASEHIQKIDLLLLSGNLIESIRGEK